MLLAIDTSAGTSVAVVDRHAGVLAARDSADTRGHAEVIGTFITECLAEAGVVASALSAVAVGMGPGPFTGLRVGIAAARAFAFGAGTLVLPLVSHDAVAFAELSDGRADPLLVVTDARRREVYWSRFDGADSDGLPVRVGGPGLCRPDELPTDVAFRRIDAPQVFAASLGLLAETTFAAGREFAADTALYLREPDVTVPAGPKRVS